MAKPLITKKKNKVAAITDGEMVIKIAIFEEFSSKVLEGVSYMMRGHELRGTNPPYLINITAKTQFFRAAVLPVPEELMAKAEDLLHSLAPVMPLRMSSTVGGLMSVDGEVMEVSV